MLHYEILNGAKQSWVARNGTEAVEAERMFLRNMHTYGNTSQHILGILPSLPSPPRIWLGHLLVIQC